MRRVVIVQARMTSTRLPGKVLMDLQGRPMLAQQLRRLRLCRSADALMIACTRNPADDPVAELARRERLECWRGSEEDVLSRYAGAARKAAADVIVRVTADCPLIDPEIVDLVIRKLDGRDYASNVLRRTYPRGLDAEALTRETLERLDREATSAPAREHVTYHILRERPQAFTRGSVEDSADNSDLRWTVDTAEDLELARRLYAALDLGSSEVPYAEILAYARAHPELAALNAHIAQKER
ncbi:MAG: glycosyltransferase family protein [Elusimicrobia bacterium]|nr:glycosyltransferase family protein [Elusimicrobiota bacterium]MDE2237612.1 glycosyltransferase family protein [Elusimicrobiota bacterium]MDE2426924.1 glycosyltransferase family protein [Elusimicrobiota bacterium]